VIEARERKGKESKESKDRKVLSSSHMMDDLQAQGHSRRTMGGWGRQGFDFVGGFVRAAGIREAVSVAAR
jgi:hypothetical protein